MKIQETPIGVVVRDDYGKPLVTFDEGTIDEQRMLARQFIYGGKDLRRVQYDAHSFTETDDGAGGKMTPMGGTGGGSGKGKNKYKRKYKKLKMKYKKLKMKYAQGTAVGTGNRPMEPSDKLNS